jgi:hypothetical protein
MTAEYNAKPFADNPFPPHTSAEVDQQTGFVPRMQFWDAEIVTVPEPENAKPIYSPLELGVAALTALGLEQPDVADVYQATSRSERWQRIRRAYFNLHIHDAESAAEEIGNLYRHGFFEVRTPMPYPHPDRPNIQTLPTILIQGATGRPPNYDSQSYRDVSGVLGERFGTNRPSSVTFMHAVGAVVAEDRQIIINRHSPAPSHTTDWHSGSGASALAPFARKRSANQIPQIEEQAEGVIIHWNGGTFSLTMPAEVSKNIQEATALLMFSENYSDLGDLFNINKTAARAWATEAKKHYRIFTNDPMMRGLGSLTTMALYRGDLKIIDSLPKPDRELTEQELRLVRYLATSLNRKQIPSMPDITLKAYRVNDSAKELVGLFNARGDNSLVTAAYASGVIAVDEVMNLGLIRSQDEEDFRAR